VREMLFFSWGLSLQNFTNVRFVDNALWMNTQAFLFLFIVLFPNLLTSICIRIIESIRPVESFISGFCARSPAGLRCYCFV
jgi:hypothetical protein